MNGVFLFLFTCLWSTFVIFFDGMIGHGVWRQFQSSHYPVTTGQVISSRVGTHHGSKGSVSYSVDIQYRYAVNDHPYSGSCFRYNVGSSDFDWATAAVQMRPAGSQTKVFFNPRNPEDSILSPDVEGEDLLPLLFLMPFNFVMIGFWSVIGRWLRERLFHPIAGGVKIIMEGPRTSIRLPEYGPLVWCMIVMGGLSLISIFIVGFATHFHPSMPVASVTLFLVIGAGAAAYVRVWVKINSGDDDLVLDETSSTIALPETYGRKERVMVNRSEIEKLSVEVITHHSSKGGTSYTYAPTLWLRHDQRIKDEKLANWTDKKRAEDFASWLGQRLNLPNVPVQAIYT